MLESEYKVIAKYSKEWKNPLDAGALHAKFHGHSDGQLELFGGGANIEAYCDFIAKEFADLIGTPGLEVIFTLNDPYSINGKPNSALMRAEVRSTGKLYIWAGGSEGPIPFATNLLFRAVHDYQHIETGGTFSFRGECYTAIPLLKRATGVTQQILFSEMVAQSAHYAVTGAYLDPQKVIVNCWDDEIDALIESARG